MSTMLARIVKSVARTIPCWMVLVSLFVSPARADDVELSGAFDMDPAIFNLSMVDPYSGLIDDSWTSYDVSFSKREKIAYFQASRAFIASWTFDYPVVAVQFYCKGNCKMSVLPVHEDGEEIVELARILSDGAGTINSNIIWSVSDNVRKFKVLCVDAGTGTFEMSRVDVYTHWLPSVSSPKGVSCVRKWRDAIEMSWGAANNAASYTLEVVSRGGEESAGIAEWSFSDYSNPGKSKIDISSELHDGLSGENVFIYQGTSGYIHVGSYSDLGYLQIDAIPPGVRYVVLRAAKYTGSSGYGGTIRVEMEDSGGHATEFEPVTLTGDFQDYVFDIDEDGIPAFASPSFTIHSPTNHIASADRKKSIIRLESIRLMESLEGSRLKQVISGITATNKVVWIDRPGEYEFKVQAVSQHGTKSSYTAPLAINITSDLPLRPRPLRLIVK